MKNRIVVWFGIATGLLAHCTEREVDINIVPEAPRLVIYGALNPDSLISIWVSQTKVATDPSRVGPIANATVLLSENNQSPRLIPLYDAERGQYQASFTPKADATYHLQVQAEGFSPIEATTRTMSLTAIEALTYEPVSTGLEPDCGLDDCTDVYRRYRIAITWTDPSNTENYYQIDGLSRDFDSLCNYDTVIDECRPSVERREYGLQFFSDDPVFSGLRGPNDAIWEGLRFSDELFDGKTYTLDYEIETVAANPDQLDIALVTLHPDIYHYEQSKDNQRIGDEAIYQNITGGYGIFSSYSQDTVVINLE